MSNEDNLLASLEAHGKEFLARFSDLETRRGEHQDGNDHVAPDVTSSASSNDDGPEEWTGFASASNLGGLDEVPERTRLDGAAWHHPIICR
jgi:hypothetical protein